MPDLVGLPGRARTSSATDGAEGSRRKHNEKRSARPEETQTPSTTGICSARSASSSSARRATCRPASRPDDDFYGVEFQVGKGYDFFTTSVYEFLQRGGDISDETSSPTPMRWAWSTRRWR